MARITIIVPVYNVESYLHRCINSILEQTYNAFELVLIDDGSPDKSGEICDEYLSKDKRIHVIHQENGGLSAARNTGITWALKNSDSEWLSFIDSDDWVHKLYLEALVNGIESTIADIAVVAMERTYGPFPKVREDYLKPVLWRVEDYYSENPISATSACGKLFRKHCFQDLRFPIGKIHEDDFTIYRILFSYSCLAVVEQPLYAYFNNTVGITGAEWSMKRLDGIEAVEQQLQYFKDNHYEKAYHSREIIYAERLSMAIQGLKKIYGSDKQKQIKVLRKKLRTILRGNRGWLNIRPWLYDSAFPKLYWLYWTLKGIKGRITKGNIG